MVPERYYCPILKWKAGEKAALQNLYPEQKDSIVPVIEIADLVNPLNFLEELKGCYEKPVYVDTIYVDQGERNYIISLFEAFKKAGILAFPVLYYDDFPELANKLTDSVNRFLVRIPVPEDIDGPSYQDIIDSLSEWSKKNTKSSTDLMLDLDIVSDKREANLQLREVKNIIFTYLLENKFYNNIIIAVTSFPGSLSTMPAGGNEMFDRYDIRLFEKILDKMIFKQLIPHIMFSDYGVTKFTDTEIDFSKLRHGVLPKARYTTNNYYWVLKGEKDRKTKQWVKNYKKLAEEIINSEVYYGDKFSFGDLEIKERANGLKGPGNNMNWVTISANHHIAVVVEQLSKIYEI